jgi:acetyltransferase-like isoleucine patch superfamily enzyme
MPIVLNGVVGMPLPGGAPGSLTFVTQAVTEVVPENRTPEPAIKKPSIRAVGNSDPNLPSFVEIGAHTYYIPAETKFINYMPPEKIIVGKYCSISRQVCIMVGGNHATDTISTYPFEALLFNQPNPTRCYRTTRNTEIGSDVWIGYGAHIAGGVHVGHGAVIASRATVFADVPPYAIVVGNPARVTKYRFSEETIEKLLRIAWWDWSDETVRNNLEWFYRPVSEFVQQFESQPSRP